MNGNGEADGKSLLTDRFAKRQETEKEITPFCPTEPAVASLSHLLFPFTGYLIPNRSAGTDVLPLILTSAGGTTSVEDIINAKIYSRARKRTEKEGNYILAAKITGEIPKMFRRPKDKEIPHLNVILGCDVDLLTPGFFRLREKGIDAASGITLDFDNVAFVLNAIDSVAGDEPLIAIRSRRTCPRTLTTIEEATRKIQNDASLAQIRFYKELEEEQERENEKLNQKISDLYNRNRDGKGTGTPGTPDPKESREIESAIVAMQDRLSRLFDEKKEQYDRKVEETRRQMDESIRKIQGRYKLYAVLFPPIPPLVVGVIVFIRRRIARLRDRRR